MALGRRRASLGTHGRNDRCGRGRTMTVDSPPRRLRLPDLQRKVASGTPVTMLTAYDALTAPIFDRAGLDMLLVGDSMGNVMLGYSGTHPTSLNDIAAATGAVARSTTRSLIVADLPFGTYEADPVLAFASSVQLIKAGAQAVKLEGGADRADSVRLLVSGGIPVVGHLGYTPQSEHALGGPRLQGRGDAAAKMLEDAQALQAAGAFALVLEMVPADVAKMITDNTELLTIGIGAGPHCNGQVLVWSDMAGMTKWTPSFVHRFAELGTALEDAARDYAQAVEDGTFPSAKNYRAT